MWYNSHQEHELNDNVIRRLKLENSRMSKELEEEPYNYDLTSVRGALQIFFDIGTYKEINKLNFGPRGVRAHEIYCSRNLLTPAFETADEHSEEGDRRLLDEG